MNTVKLKFRSILPLLLMSLFLGGSTYPYVAADAAGGIEFKFVTEDSRMKSLVRSMKFVNESKQIDIETVKTIVSVEFLDVNSEVIFTVPVGTSSLNIGVESYPKGVYYLKLLLEDENDFISTRIIKDF